MKKAAVWIIVLLLAAAGGGYWYYSSRAAENEAGAEQTPETYTDNTVGKVIGTGTVCAGDDVYLYVETAQTVSEIHVKEGDSVSIGDVLVEYDIAQTSRELSRKLDEAEINLSNARLTLESIGQPASGNELLAYNSELNAAVKNVTLAENDLASFDIKIEQQRLMVEDARRNLEKIEILYNSGVAPQNQLDSARTNSENAEKSLGDLLVLREAKEEVLQMRLDQQADAEKRIENATNRLDDKTTYIKYMQQENVVKMTQLSIDTIKDELKKLSDNTVSPVNGSVLAVNIYEGGVATKPNYVVKLADMSRIIVMADITEYDAPLLAVGQSVEISTSGLPDKIYYGTITKISQHAVEKEKPSGKEVVVPIEITVTNGDEALKTGYTVDVEILVSES